MTYSMDHVGSRFDLCLHRWESTSTFIFMTVTLSDWKGVGRFEALLYCRVDYCKP